MNPLLQKTEQAVLAKVSPPQLKPVVQKLVDAGKKIMYAPETRQMFAQQMSGPGELSEKIGAGVAKLMGLVLSQVKGTAPPKAYMPAAIMLLCEGMDFLEQAGQIKVDNDTLAEATKETASGMLQLVGATPEKLQQMLGASGAPAEPAPAAPAAAPQGIIGAAIGGA